MKNLYRSIWSSLLVVVSFAGMAFDLVAVVLRSILPEPSMAKLEAELEQAKAPSKVTDHRKPVSELFGTAQARNFVTMLRGIGSNAATA